ncbi:MAG: S41 family peptidase [Acidobacteriota bacterium]
MHRIRIRLGTLLLFIVTLAAALGGLLGEKVSAETPLEEGSQKLLKTFTEVLATVQQNYADKTKSGVLVGNAIRGMLRTLDPHSSYFSTEDYDRLQEEQKGKYYGLGITIRSESPGSGRVVVVEPPAPGTPAYKAGLHAGDVIAKIEGKPIDDWDLNEEVIPNLKGPKGTFVNITVERPGEDEPLQFRVERDEIPLYTIKYAFRIRPKIGYIRISRFAETTSRELDKALDSIGEDSLEGLILDLRDNPGGALSQALAVSDRFLDKGEKIVATRSRNGKESRVYRAERTERYHYPMVVLINRNSASASEIVSGALQDHDRALILGETSFGKALVQTIFPLAGQRALALTTGRYYTPSNRLIQRDYSHGFWDYYNSRSDEQASVHHDGKEYFTDGGRIVYGGGGIMPDQEVGLDRIPLTARKIQRKNLFRDYASKVVSGEIPSSLLNELPAKPDKLQESQADEVITDLQIRGESLEHFRKYVANHSLTFTDAEWNSARPVIRNFLKQELLLLLVGDEASYRVALNLDKQVQTAIERLPQVTVLLQKSMTEARSQNAQP